MKHFLSLLLTLLVCSVDAQTVFVNADQGKPEAAGTSTDPVNRLETAVRIARSFTGDRQITIKLAPGLYTLDSALIISGSGTEAYTIEAQILPTDTNWHQWSTPVITSVSANNSTYLFPHASAFLVRRNNVHFRGLKFTGNPHPLVKYYYPINREDSVYDNLEISRCYFTGEKNSSRIQSGAWVNGPGLHVDHCIFSGCKNALVIISNISRFSLTHSIVQGSYEAALYCGRSVAPFTFHNNIITGCEYVVLRPEGIEPPYDFRHSVITGNDHFIGASSKGGIEDVRSTVKETAVQHAGKVVLVQTDSKATPDNYLHCVPGTAGSELEAGVRM